MLRVQVDGKRRDIGLGAVDVDGLGCDAFGKDDARHSDIPLMLRKSLSLAEAREKASALRKLAKAGSDPKVERDRQRAKVPSFTEAVTEAHNALKSGWSDRTAKAFKASLEEHANTSVADLIERMMSLSDGSRTATGQRQPVRTGPADRALRRARLCYDHLAGEIAVAITDSMIARGHLEFGQDGGIVTDQGVSSLAGLGIELASGVPTRLRGAAFCRPCLDWSERRPHVAGLVGRAMYDRFVRLGWVRRSHPGRTVSITPRGVSELSRHFGVTL